MKRASTYGWLFWLWVTVGGVAVVVDVVYARHGSALQQVAHYVSVGAGVLALLCAFACAGFFFRSFVSGNRQKSGS